MITDIREFDVTFHSRVCIDLGLRAGKWFEVEL
jgi:DNA polymerase elongation subunit (family B)